MTRSMLRFVVPLLVLCLGGANAQVPEGFTLHARFSGIGAVLGTTVAPGPEAGSQRVYASHIYGGGTLDLVAIDPATGTAEVFSSPVAGECGAWAVVAGPDDCVYLGTLPAAHILKLDWTQHKLVDMGIPSDTEQYIWQLVVGSDKKLYGCTYPNAKLVRFDPATGKGEDLGRMNETEQYARQVAADNEGFVYVGVGMSARDLVAYEIASGRHQSILPADLAGQGCATVLRGADGHAYANVAGHWLVLDGFKATGTPDNRAPDTVPLQLADGRHVSLQGRGITLTAADGKTEQHAVDYAGKPLDIFRLGLGPDGRLYGSTAMPIHFFWADPDSDKHEEIAEAGGGEFYSYLAWQDKLIAAAYSAPSPIMIYQPKLPWKPGTTPQDNPWQIHYEGANSSWRPTALIAGPQDKVYIGAVSGYGLLGGPLCVLDPVTGKVDQYLHLVKDQSVVCLAVTQEGLIVGGTTIGGGGGSHATQTEAKLFLWDPVKRDKLFEMVPVPGRTQLEALAVGQDGLVYGFAGDTLFAFDPVQRQVLKTAPHGLGRVCYNAVAPGPGGKLYGIASGGVFMVDEAARGARLLATYPPGAHSGFAIRGRDLIFVSGPQIVSYRLPEN